MLKADIYPFKTSFSLSKLINFWEKRAVESQDSCERDFAVSLTEKVKQIPELNGIINDREILNKHRQTVNELFTAVIPPAYADSNLQAITPPLELMAVYCTDRFRRLFCKEDGDFGFDFLIEDKKFMNGKIMAHYARLLNQFYKIKFSGVYPIIRKIIDPKTGLNRYFRLNIDGRFMDIKLTGILPLLTKDQITWILENIITPEKCYELIPPDRFEFSGLLVISMFEVTEQEALSSLKQDLLKKDILSSKGGFSDIETKIRTMFRNPRLQLGLVALSDDKSKLLNAGHKIGNSFLMNESCVNCCKDYRGSIYDAALESSEPQIIYDLDSMNKCSPVDNAIAEQGIKNLLVARLDAEGRHIGMLEIASDVPGDLNAVNAAKITDVLPLFSLALSRSIEDIENKVQGIIKDKCTAIHKSVEWRFRKAAYNVLEKEKQGEYSAMEDIIFKDVFPIYALSDIRNSSLLRNKAVQSDLKHNLLLAIDIVNEAYKCKSMPVLELLKYRIEEKIFSLDAGLHSGDESSIISFLKREVEALFPLVSGFGIKVAEAIKTYNNSLDAKLGFYFDKRKNFEESVAILNETVALLVDEEEVKAQSFFPHYFEKYKTDGVEYSIYIGDSIAEEGGFDELYLKNLRLWQLLLMCKVVLKAEELKSKLPVNLELAHLLLVQNSPLSIRFHYDQKKFDVDGAYNAHYEILKKRIDKAEVMGKNERLTQPGKIAIVYSQPSEANEYKKYIGFLQTKGFIEEGIEDLEIKELQGVHGLKALRVKVNLINPKVSRDIDIDTIIRQVEKINK